MSSLRRSTVPAFSILDSHLQLPSALSPDSPYAAWNLSERTFLEHLERCGVRKGIVHAVPGAEKSGPDSFLSANRDLLRFLERFPGRFTGACAIDLDFVEESLREMEDWRKQFGMVWVADIAFDPRRSDKTRRSFGRLLAQAGALSMVISVDTDSEGMKYIGEHHPEATIVFPQLEKDRAYPRIQIASQRDAFYFDTTYRGYERMGLIELALEELGADRLLYGSNFAIHDPAAVIARIENAFLSDDQKQALFSGNAVKLLEQAGWTF